MTVGLGPGLGKDFATSLGPCLTTADAIDIAAAPMRARVNGRVWSEGTLGAMRFGFAEVVAHISQEQPLVPGDVLGSGTVGRGCGLELDRWIRPGDVVELEVEGIGVLRTRVGSPDQRARPAAAGAATRT
jgi:2-keto-4-pentenoate hydratase/2-oxohepta-3-ene-1,7-dioic acid hydratase in catechol pathway